MNITFDLTKSARPLASVIAWTKILKCLKEEHEAEKVKIEFKAWVKEKYEVELNFTDFTDTGLTVAINYIISIDVPDEMVTYLELRFS